MRYKKGDIIQCNTYNTKFVIIHVLDNINTYAVKDVEKCHATDHEIRMSQELVEQFYHLDTPAGQSMIKTEGVTSGRFQSKVVNEVMKPQTEEASFEGFKVGDTIRLPSLSIVTITQILKPKFWFKHVATLKTSSASLSLLRACSKIDTKPKTDWTPTPLRSAEKQKELEKDGRLHKRIGDSLHIKVPNGYHVDYSKLEPTVFANQLLDEEKRLERQTFKDLTIAERYGMQERLSQEVIDAYRCAYNGLANDKLKDSSAMQITMLKSALTDAFALADPGVVKRVLKKYPELIDLLEGKGK